MKVLIVREKYVHHTSHSGYDILFNGLLSPEFEFVYVSFRYRKLKRAINKFLTIILPKIFNSRWYRFEQFWLEFKIAKAILRYKPDVVHITHSHEQFKIITKKYFRSRTSFIGTIHMPYAFWKAGRRKKEWLDFYEKLVVLDEHSLHAFSGLFGQKVYLIPHPVDTAYYTPILTVEEKRKKPNFECFFAGRFLRDIEMLLDIVKKLYAKDPSITFHIAHPLIYSPELLYYKMAGIISLPSVRFHGRISNEELLRQYREADLMVMPLFDSTANNVFLEAAACDNVVLATRTNGSPTYLPDKLKEVIGNFFTADEIVEMVIKLKNDPNLYKEISLELGGFVREKFPVQKIWAETIALYQSLANARLLNQQ